jgi:hypothetical protein
MKKFSNLLPKKLPKYTVCAQMVRCGKSTCKCANGELHGPYYYSFSRRNGSLKKRYIKTGDVDRMRARYCSRRAHETQMRDLNTTHQRLFSSLKSEIKSTELICRSAKGK